MLEYLTVDDVPESLLDIVSEIGLDNFKKLIVVAGGSSIYFPSMDRIVVPVRNRIIKSKFRGNYKELGVMFGISEMQVRNIVNKG